MRNTDAIGSRIHRGSQCDCSAVFQLYLYQFVTNSLATFLRMCVLQRPFMTYFYNFEPLSIAVTVHKIRRPPESACTAISAGNGPQISQLVVNYIVSYSVMY